MLLFGGACTAAGNGSGGLGADVVNVVGAIGNSRSCGSAIGGSTTGSSIRLYILLQHT